VKRSPVAAQPTQRVRSVAVRKSTIRQIGNYRAEAQTDLADVFEARGYVLRSYDEQGTSDADLAKRKVTMRMLDDLKRGEIHGIAAYHIRRLTRDEFGIDGGTIARPIVQAGGRLITRDREYDLRYD
jgi:DNA invertase Pin-like site-specific DNA recombinase